MQERGENMSRRRHLTRRQWLSAAGRAGLGAVALGWLGTEFAGCTSRPQVRLGIVAGSQTLWRYVAQNRGDLLQPLGYDATFLTFPTEAALRQTFVAGQLDIMATLPPLVPSLVEAGADVQFFLPVAWIKEGYPLVVPAQSPARTLPDLAGYTLASFPLSHPGLAYWRAFVLQNYGFRLEEKLRLQEHDEPAALLVDDQADAAFVDSMSWSSLKPGGRFRLITDLNAEWVKIAGSSRLLMYGGYVAHRNWIVKHKKFVDGFIRVNQEALQLYQTDPSRVLRSAATYAEQSAPQLDEEENRFIAAYLGYDDTPPDRMRISPQDVADYEKVFALLAQAGYLEREPRSVATLFYLPG